MASDRKKPAKPNGPAQQGEPLPPTRGRDVSSKSAGRRDEIRTVAKSGEGYYRVVGRAGESYHRVQGRDGRGSPQIVKTNAQPEPVKTGAQLVDYWKRNGLIGFRADIEDTDAEYARLRAEAQTRAHEG